MEMELLLPCGCSSIIKHQNTGVDRTERVTVSSSCSLITTVNSKVVVLLTIESDGGALHTNALSVPRKVED